MSPFRRKGKALLAHHERELVNYLVSALPLNQGKALDQFFEQLTGRRSTRRVGFESSSDLEVEFEASGDDVWPLGGMVQTTKDGEYLFEFTMKGQKPLEIFYYTRLGKDPVSQSLRLYDRSPVVDAAKDQVDKMRLALGCPAGFKMTCTDSSDRRISDAEWRMGVPLPDSYRSLLMVGNQAWSGTTLLWTDVPEPVSIPEFDFFVTGGHEDWSKMITIDPTFTENGFVICDQVAEKRTPAGFDYLEAIRMLLALVST